MAIIASSSVQTTDEIFKDKNVLEVKNKMMGKLKLNAMLGSVSRVATFIGGPLLAGGLGVGLGSVLSAMANGATLLGAITGLALPVVGTLVAGAVFVGVAVAADYAATRIWQSSQFDNFEMNAESTARHLVKELKVNSMCLTQEHEQNQRADGKSWVQAVRPQQALQPVQSLE